MQFIQKSEYGSTLWLNISRRNPTTRLIESAKINIFKPRYFQLNEYVEIRDTTINNNNPTARDKLNRLLLNYLVDASRFARRFGQNNNSYINAIHSFITLFLLTNENYRLNVDTDTVPSLSDASHLENISLAQWEQAIRELNHINFPGSSYRCYNDQVPESIRDSYNHLEGTDNTSNTEFRAPRRTVNQILSIRPSYHAEGQGSNRPRIESSLNLIPFDEDGVRYSFGPEYEMSGLTEENAEELKTILQTLPSHVIEHDATVQFEIVFDPMSASDYIRTVNTLKDFVNRNHIDMARTGMHTTFGVSNNESSARDIQMRLNRICLWIAGTTYKKQRIDLFGRDFGDYTVLPSGRNMESILCSGGHSFAFNADANGQTRKNCWEFRLPNWKADAERLVKFLKRTAFVFHRPPNLNDFIDISKIINGDNCFEQQLAIDENNNQ